ncbi:hypothetical protein IU462_30355, partial [Nocardia farcinica]|nr:hypothetical protein [Nocardia farcinica]
GIDALAKLTEGEVFLGVNENSPFAKVKNATIRQFSGPHPAGKNRWEPRCRSPAPSGRCAPDNPGCRLPSGCRSMPGTPGRQSVRPDRFHHPAAA